MKWLKIIGGALAFFFAIMVAQNIKKYLNHVSAASMKKLAKVKKYKKQAHKDREKAEQSFKKAKQGNKKRKSIRNKYSKVVPILLLLIILPSLLSARFIVWNEEDQVNRDYGNITNYIKSLEEEKIIFLATQGHFYKTIEYYSNAFMNMTNAADLQDEVIQDQQPSWCSRMWTRTKFYVGFVTGSGLVLLLLL